MASPPPPYDDITGISRAAMKDNAQVTLAEYDGNARPGELVVDQTTSIVYVGNALGDLTAVATPGGATTWALLNNKTGAAGPTIIALGQNAGLDGQANAAIALGQSAGQGGQGGAAISIGLNTGGNIFQGAGAIAIGSSAGFDGQGVNAVSIGVNAGLFVQGASAVAIGALAGYTGQPANTIILNATGVAVNGVAAQTNSFYVDPIRTTANGTPLIYNSTTKEITYSTVLEFVGSKISTNDSSGLTVDVQTTFNTDVTVENDLDVTQRLRVQGSRVINITELQAIVAASTDFTAFKTAIAGLV